MNDLNRISKRVVIGLKDWRENSDDVVPSASVEEPVYRKEFGLWEHQKYFVELAFREHKKDGGARFLLADQVGLGKTLQLAMSAKLMALYGDKPVLIIVPKTLVWQWQNEMKTLLNMPSAVWTGAGWQDENGYFYQADSVRSIIKCPIRVGIISQGLVSRKTDAAGLLAQKDFECVILDEAHSAYFVAEKLSKDSPDNVIGLYAGGDKSGYFINGNYHKDSKDSIKAKVKSHEIKILVGTDAASEGLNLQTLSTLINLDLPWNPTRLEQIKCRIQRIGRVAPKVKSKYQTR